MAVTADASCEDLGDVDVKRGIFEGVFHQLFALSMVPLSLILRMVNASYEWGKEKYRLNHFLFIGDLKLFFKSEEQMYTLLRTVHVFSTDVGFEFEIK